MVPYGLVWSSIVPYGPVWPRMVPYRLVWSSMVPYGTVWCITVSRQGGGGRLKKMDFYEMHSIVITFVFNYFMWRNFLLLENLNLKLLEYFQTKFES